MVTTQKAPKEQRNKEKKGDIPFPIVYFGFIIAFVAVKHRRMYDALPSLEEHKRTVFVPSLEVAMLPLFSFFVFCPILYVWRGFVKSHLLASWAKDWAGLTEGTVKYEKFCEQAWLALHYTIATSLGYYVLRETPWWPPLSESGMLAISASQAEREADQKDLGLQVLYSMQLAFYTLELATLLSSKQRRSDAMVYFFHHIYTLFLMSGSWISYNHRVGSLVLFLHDIGDIFLPIGKCYTYAEEHIRVKHPQHYAFHKNVGMSAFVLFVIFFAIPRLILYGGLVYRSMLDFHWLKCCGIDLESGYCGPCLMGSGWTTPLVMTLGFLYPMHVYWFYLIVKMAARLLLSPGEYDDVRSGSEKND